MKKPNSSFTIIAGPCSVESQAQLLDVSSAVIASGSSALRGGIFKMRTSPNAFQGFQKECLPWINAVKKQTGLNIVSEITDPRQVSLLQEAVDIFQVGSRNMYNYELLKELSFINKPIILKRGFSATVKEWIKAAEYLQSAGNPHVILCERGIRTFETSTRNTIDLNSVAYLKANTDFTVFVDPSHGTGVRNLVKPLSLAAIAAGADGLLIEVHPQPEQALSDGHQSLNCQDFLSLVSDAKKLLTLFNKTLNNSMQFSQKYDISSLTKKLNAHSEPSLSV
ncbi:MAG: 3-deoxy-7-phosphoheptulonate synthase [Bdellovibrionaceae bacterium]|nr:3-deoxy-7-phosphoheptulonate synthase [Pseudobdellovibrionaceae bacterium]